MQLNSWLTSFETALLQHGRHRSTMISRRRRKPRLIYAPIERLEDRTLLSGFPFFPLDIVADSVQPSPPPPQPSTDDLEGYCDLTINTADAQLLTVDIALIHCRSEHEFVGHIATASESDLFELQVTTSGRLDLFLTAASGSALDPQLQLFDDRGRLLILSDDHSAGTTSAKLEQHLKPGNYRVEVTSFSDGITSAADIGGEYILSTTFQAATSPQAALPVGLAPRSLVAGDFNQDGHTDLATANSNSSDVSLLLGLGDGTFAPAVSLPVGRRPNDIIATDLNGDGFLDLVTANQASVAATISVVYGNGDGTFQPALDLEGLHPSNFLLAQDFNNDGAVDLAATSYDSRHVIVYLANGSGGFAAGQETTVGHLPGPLVSADFDGDAILDLAVANEGSNDVTILTGAGDGTFLAGSVLPVSAPPSDLVADDFNDDDILDLAVTHADQVSIYLGSGDGTFAVTGTWDFGRAPRSIATEDFNGDGHRDIITSNQAANGISIRLGNGDGSLGTEVRFPTGATPWGITLGDFNGDILLDVAVANFKGDSVSVLLGQGDGQFRHPPQFSTGFFPHSITGGDFDGDGWFDIVTADRDSRTLSILCGVGDGTFHLPIQLEIADGKPAAVVAVDVNVDGRLDLVVANSAGTVDVFLGLGNSSFQPGQRLSAGDRPYGLVAVDFNADGKVDLAVTNDGSADVFVFYGMGDGSFAAGPVVPVGQGPRDITTGDWNQDGHLDFATANRDSNTLSVAYATGSGGFDVGAPIAVGDAPLSIESADFNADGLDDLAIVNGESDTVSIVLGTAGGSFVLSTAVAVGQNPESIVTGDWNSDGHIDLLTANIGGNNLSFLAGNGDGTFQSSVDLQVGSEPAAVLAGDFNADGRLDMASANRVSDDVSVLLGLGDGSFINSVLVSLGAATSVPIVIPSMSGTQTGGSVVLTDGGQILYREARPQEPGRFEPPVVVNPQSPVRTVALVNNRASSGALASSITLAAIDRTGHSISVYTGDNNGEFVRLDGPSSPGGLWTQLRSADVNGDGWGDLIVADAAFGHVRVYLAVARNQFAAPTLIPIDEVFSEYDVLDTNDDGQLELVLTGRQTGDVMLWSHLAGSRPTSKRWRASADVFGVQVPPSGIPLVQTSRASSRLVKSVDISGDQTADLILADTLSPTLSVLLGKGRTGYVDPVMTVMVAPAVALATGDFTGDGLMDLAVLHPDAIGIVIYAGNGRGEFVAGFGTQVGGQLAGLTAQDLNADGITDLLVSNAVGDVLVLPGRGNGTFGTLVRVDRSVPITVDDLDGDGQADVILANSAENRIFIQFSASGESLLLENDSGLLAPGLVKAAQLNDDNGDGLVDNRDFIDLLVASTGGNQIFVYPGTGPGQFATSLKFYTGTSPSGITVEDLNGDGLPDLVVANRGSNDVSVLMNHSDDSQTTTMFRAGPRLAVGYGPVSTWVRDVTNDGVADLLVANAGSGTISYLTGIGGGFYDDRSPQIVNVGSIPNQGGILVGNAYVVANPTTNSVTFIPDVGQPSIVNTFRFDSLAHPSFLAPFDYNADGIFDLIVANNGDGSVVLLAGYNNGFRFDARLTELGLDYPSAIALNELSDSGRLQILVTDEGEEIATVFELDLQKTYRFPSIQAFRDDLEPNTLLDDRLLAAEIDAIGVFGSVRSSTDSADQPFARFEVSHLLNNLFADALRHVRLTPHRLAQSTLATVVKGATDAVGWHRLGETLGQRLGQTVGAYSNFAYMPLHRAFGLLADTIDALRRTYDQQANSQADPTEELRARSRPADTDADGSIGVLPEADLPTERTNSEETPPATEQTLPADVGERVEATSESVEVSGMSAQEMNAILAAWPTGESTPLKLAAPIAAEVGLFVYAIGWVRSWRRPRMGLNRRRRAAGSWFFAERTIDGEGIRSSVSLPVYGLPEVEKPRPRHV